MSDQSQIAQNFAAEFKKENVGEEFVPRQWGRYQVLRKIGQGGMGQVFEAYDPLLKRKVALKLLISEDKESIERFLREAQTTATLDHPNIIRLYDVQVFEGHPFFTMELIEGLTLKEYVKNHHSGLRLISQIIMLVAKAIHKAHQNNIVHRDLKPANIMVNHKGIPIVMDFGLAKLTKASRKFSKTGFVIGTLFYMSPEQAKGKLREIDAQSDVYALGIILYELITGKIPFQGNEPQVLNQIFNIDPISPRKIKKTIHRDLENICLKAMAKEKQYRYPSALALAQDLEAFINGENINVKSVPLWKKLHYKIRRSPIAIALLISCCLFSIGIVAYLLNEQARWEKIQRQKNEQQQKYTQIAEKIDSLMVEAQQEEELFLQNVYQNGSHPKLGVPILIKERDLFQEALQLCQVHLQDQYSKNVHENQEIITKKIKTTESRLAIYENTTTTHNFRDRLNLIASTIDLLEKELTIVPNPSIHFILLYYIYCEEEETLEQEMQKIAQQINNTTNAQDKRNLIRKWLSLGEERKKSIETSIDKLKDSQKISFSPVRERDRILKLGYQYMRLGILAASLQQNPNYQELKIYFLFSAQYIDEAIDKTMQQQLTGEVSGFHMNRYYALLQLTNVVRMYNREEALLHGLDTFVQNLRMYQEWQAEHKTFSFPPEYIQEFEQIQKLVLSLLPDNSSLSPLIQDFPSAKSQAQKFIDKIMQNLPKIKMEIEKLSATMPDLGIEGKIKDK